MNLFKKFIIGVFALLIFGIFSTAFAVSTTTSMNQKACGNNPLPGYTTALCDAHVVLQNNTPTPGAVINADFWIDATHQAIGAPIEVKFNNQSPIYSSTCVPGYQNCKRAWATGITAPMTDGCYNLNVSYKWNMHGTYEYSVSIPYIVGAGCGNSGGSGNTPVYPDASIGAEPANIYEGEPTTISWDSQNANHCTVYQGDPLDGGIPIGNTTSGSESVSLDATTTFEIHCSSCIAKNESKPNNLAVNSSFIDKIKNKLNIFFPIARADMTNPCGPAEASTTVTVTPAPPAVVTLTLDSSSEKDLVKKSDTSNLGTTYLEIMVNHLPSGSCILKNITTGSPVGTPFYNSGDYQYPIPNVSNLQNSDNDFRLECPTNPTLNTPTVRVKAQSGELTVPSTCTILSGGNACSPVPTISWTTTNPYSTSPTQYTSIYQDGTKVLQTQNTGSGSVSIPGTGIPVGGTSKTVLFESKNSVDGENNGPSATNTLDTKTMIVSCAPTTTWNGSICAPTATVPTVTTAPVTQITQTSAKGSGTVVSNGGSAVSVSGITWSKLPIPTNKNPNTILSEFKTTTGWAIGGPWTPIHNMGQLDPNSTYYYRAYAINGVGYAYGNQVTFTTLPDTTNVMFGSLTGSPNPCIIAQGSSTCNTSLSWTINNIESTTSNITANGMASISLSTPVIGNDYGGTIPNVGVPYPSRTFFLNNNSKSLVPTSPGGLGRIVNAQCATGTSWNNSICAAQPTSGTLTATNCSIPLGGNSCNTSLNWATTNPIPGVISAITSSYPFNNTQVFTGNNGTNQTATVPYDSRAFYLYHNNVPLASVNPSALCTFGTAWNPTSHTCVSSVTYTVTASAGANGTISPLTRIVNAGATTTFTVTPNSGYSANIGGTCPRGGFVGTTYTTGPITSNCTVSAAFSYLPVSGNLTISPLSCDIAQNASTCTVTGATWTTLNATQPSLVDVNTGNVLSTLANNSTPLQVWVAYPQTDFALKHINFPGILDTERVTAKCVKNTTWDGSKCIAEATGLSGTITASDCTISDGQSKCASKIVWKTVNPIAGHTSEVTTPININVGSGNDGTQDYDITFGETYFFLNHNSIELAQDKATAICSATSGWNGSTCVAGGGGGVTNGDCGDEVDTCDSGDFKQKDDSPESYIWQCLSIPEGGYSPICTKSIGGGGSGDIISIDFTASPKRIFKGRSSTLTWTTNADSCEGYTDNENSPFVTNGQANGTFAVKPNQTTIYTLSCKKDGASDASQNAEVKVSVIKFFEI